jgi:hypothetical protein
MRQKASVSKVTDNGLKSGVRFQARVAMFNFSLGREDSGESVKPTTYFHGVLECVDHYLHTPLGAGPNLPLTRN